METWINMSANTLATTHFNNLKRHANNLVPKFQNIKKITCTLATVQYPTH